MMKQVKPYKKRLISFFLAALITLSSILVNGTAVFAADGTLTFNSGETIPYGDYFTTRMTFDGENRAYCVEPLKTTPSAGTYDYDLLAKDSPVRKALYYLPGGYGYEKSIQSPYLGGWAEDDAYVIGHLVVAYIYAGYTADSGAFYGAPQNYIDKALEVTNAINALPAPPENFRAFIIPGNGDQTIAGSWYQKPYGWIELRKSSANASVTDGNGNYSLKGAQYGIYKGEQLLETLTTDKNGYAKSKELEADITYTVRELKASPGFIVDVNSFDVFVKSETGTTLEVTEVPRNNPIDLVLQKLDSETKGNTPQGAASLEHAEFTMKFYASQLDTDPAAAGETPLRTWVFRTDASGKIHFSKAYLVSGDDFFYASDKKTPTLPLGTVTIQETKAPTGYFASEGVTVQKISGNGDQETISVYNASEVEEQIYRGGVKIQKRDIETTEAQAQGGATLKGAEFSITTLNNNPVLVDGKSYTKDQVVMTLTTDDSGIAATAKDALPFGHYRVDEIKAPEGYLNQGIISHAFDITEDGKIVELTAEDSSISNQVIRGDLEFVKVSDGDLNRLSNVPFSITSKTTKESHVIVTDKNGYASTASKWNKHTSNTNRGETSEDGIWFGTSKADDSKGALIYDTYIIEEQKCKANEGMNLLKFEAAVYKDSVVIDLGTLTNDQITIATTALDEESGSHMAKPEESITLVDTVEYEGLKKGTEYKLVGTLMDRETGKPVLVNDKPVTAEITFKAKKSTGSAKVKFTFNATSLAGKTVVVFEDLYQDDLKLAVHADIMDEDQTIYFPEIRTSAKDSDTDSSISCADKKVELIDTVTYKNLVPGETFKIAGTLMDKETGKPLDVDGKPVTSTVKFTPKEASGTIDISFTFDGSALQGRTIVVFESVTHKDKEVAAHADLEDIGQTIFFPELSTTAADQKTGTQHAAPDKEVTIVDVVEYKNLIADGRTYHLTGTLMDKETEKALEVDGKAVTAETEFTPKEAAGSIELAFTFDGSLLEGKTVVAFESLRADQKEVAVHADIEDQAQSVFFPTIGTKAKDGKDGDQEALADKKVTIVDTVTYKNLIADGKHTYRIKGVLMDKETQKELLIGGKQVTAEAEFKPDKSEGSIELTFNFDGSTLAGHDIVVFEKLYFVAGDAEMELASHEDITDQGQTVKLTELPKEKTPSETPTVSNPVKTGDDTNTTIYVVIAIVSGILLISTCGYLIYNRKKNQDK
ncbi:MAG: VaFE repeat-containing surface-anchored protein [Eubacteriales bacterium]|nr:VaFE repeat-containing surface-anchored protein [Eubacteriales bacterium]